MVNLKTLAIVAVCLSTAACELTASDAYQVSSEFTDAEFAIIQDEVAHLCEVNEGRCISVTRDDAINRIAMADLGGTHSGAFVENADGSSVIVLDSIVVDMGYLARAFRHELGHAAGCATDSATPGNVMYYEKYTVPQDLEWTHEDLACINK